MPVNPELIESIRLCKKLQQTMRDDCLIPASCFAGETARALTKIREQQLKELEKITKELSFLTSSNRG